MKKLIICLIGAIILSCNDGGKKDTKVGEYSNGERLYVDHYYHGGMHYVVFSGFSSYTTGVSAVNVTRDSLQCEIIKQNLKNQKNARNTE
jgi:hypothetical protein